MSWYHTEKEITKADSDKNKTGEAKLTDFFTEAELCGYGAIPRMPYESEGKYYIPYGISDSCD